MVNISEKSGLDTLKLITFITGIAFIIVCFSLLAVRITSVIKDSLYCQSSGGEAPGLYGIYKVWLGDPVYTLLKDCRSVMLFNFLFYYGYGYLARLFVSNAEGLPLFAKLLTFFWTIFFLALIFVYLWYIIRRAAFKRCDWMAVAVIFPERFGHLRLLTWGQRQEAPEKRRIVISSAKPVFVEPAYFALPWNCGQYPSDVIEWTIYPRLKNAKLITTLESRIKDKYYAEAFVSKGVWCRLLEESGYKKIAQYGNLIRFVRENYGE